jgi:hypothetical protein
MDARQMRQLRPRPKFETGTWGQRHRKRGRVRLGHIRQLRSAVLTDGNCLFSGVGTIATDFLADVPPDDKPTPAQATWRFPSGTAVLHMRALVVQTDASLPIPGRRRVGSPSRPNRWRLHWPTC